MEDQEKDFVRRLKKLEERVLKNDKDIATLAKITEEREKMQCLFIDSLSALLQALSCNGQQEQPPKGN